MGVSLLRLHDFPRGVWEKLAVARPSKQVPHRMVDASGRGPDEEDAFVSRAQMIIRLVTDSAEEPIILPMRVFPRVKLLAFLRGGEVGEICDSPGKNSPLVPVRLDFKRVAAKREVADWGPVSKFRKARRGCSGEWLAFENFVSDSRVIGSVPSEDGPPPVESRNLYPAASTP